MHSLPRRFVGRFRALPTLLLLALGTLEAADVIAPAPTSPTFGQNLRVGAGPQWIQNAQLDSLSYARGEAEHLGTNNPARAPVYASFPGQSDVEFDMGPAFVLAVGGQLPIPSWLHAEIETGFAINSLDFWAADQAMGGDLWQVPVLVNLSVPWRINDRWEVVGGIGGGIVIGGLDLNPASLQVRDLPDAENTIGLGGTSITAMGAYQAYAQLRYRLGPATALSLGYRFRGTSAPKWSGQEPLDGVEGDWDLGFSPLYSHAALVTFDWKW